MDRMVSFSRIVGFLSCGHRHFFPLSLAFWFVAGWIKWKIRGFEFECGSWHCELRAASAPQPSLRVGCSRVLFVDGWWTRFYMYILLMHFYIDYINYFFFNIKQTVFVERQQPIFRFSNGGGGGRCLKN